MRASPERIVFIDETSVRTNLTRQCGWAPRGHRLVMDASFGSWGTQTVIAGLSAEAMIAPWIIKGAMDGPAFAAYVEKVLVPELAPGTVVILDNLATHRNVDAAKALRDAGCWFLFLPPARSQSHRDGVFKAQGPFAQDRRQNLHGYLPRHRPYLRSLQSRRVLELSQGRWICCRLMAGYFRVC